MRTDRAGAPVERPLAKAAIRARDSSRMAAKDRTPYCRLTADVPDDIARADAEQQARWLLAYILDWHRREKKAVWWEYFRPRDLSAEDLLDERAGLSGLAFVGTFGGTAKAPIHRYAFSSARRPNCAVNEDLRSVGGDKFGKVEAISLDDRTSRHQEAQDTANVHPLAVFAHKIVIRKVLPEALIRLGEYVADNGMTATAPIKRRAIS